MKILIPLFVVLMAILCVGCATPRCPDMVIGSSGLISSESMSAHLACMINGPPAPPAPSFSFEDAEPLLSLGVKVCTLLLLP